MSDPLIRLQGVRISRPSLGDQPGFVLSVPEWQVARGRRLALMGPSGAGKTTLLQVLSGRLVADVGEVHVDGAALHQADEAARRAFRIARVGQVFQRPELLADLNALENILVPCRIHRAAPLTRARRQRARSLAEELGLGPRLGHRPHQLSMGEQQRVALARALLLEPTLVLADEPTSHLDQATGEAVMQALEAEVSRLGATLIMVTHNPAHRARFDEVIDLLDRWPPS